MLDYLDKQKGIEARTTTRLNQAVKKMRILKFNSVPDRHISIQGEAALIGTAKRSEDGKIYNTVKASKAVINKFKIGIMENDGDDDSVEFHTTQDIVPQQDALPNSSDDWSTARPQIELGRRNISDDKPHNSDASRYTDLEHTPPSTVLTVEQTQDAPSNHMSWIEAECDELRRSMESIKM